MKIRLTENQYRRLLKEDDKSFLDGLIEFKSIDKKLHIAIAKLFVRMQKEGKFIPNLNYLKLDNPLYEGHFSKIVDYIMLALVLTQSESILLAHNYCSFLRDKIVNASEKNEPKLLEGEPLQFFGKYTYPITYYWSGYITGNSGGNLECYATDDKDFLKKIDDGIFETIEISNDYIDYDMSEVHWEPNDDVTFDSIESDIDLDEITIDI